MQDTEEEEELDESDGDEDEEGEDCHRYNQEFGDVLKIRKLR